MAGTLSWQRVEIFQEELIFHGVMFRTGGNVGGNFRGEISAGDFLWIFGGIFTG